MNANGMRELNRRVFLQSSAVLALGRVAVGAAGPSGEPEPINVAVVGLGGQGLQLMEWCRRTPGVRVQAVCDIWAAYNLRRGSRIAQKINPSAAAYTDFERMLAEEKGLHAAIVATPDFWHARHTVACLEAGLHVYCEAPMSNTLEGARSMAEAARRTGRLLQIGHWRRSNPRYIYCREKVLGEMRLLGRVVAVNGQWDRARQPPLGWPRNCPVDDGTLRTYGYASMHQFRNWRWYKGLGGGPVVDLGSHQIDVYNWFLGTRPRAVLASGRSGYYREEGFEWPDTVMAIYEYDASQGPVDASYQVLSANSSFGRFEAFKGDEGTLAISDDPLLGEVYPEPLMDDSTWTKWVEKGLLKSPAALTRFERDLALPMYLVAETPPPVFKRLPYKLPVKTDKGRDQTHVENFFDAIRGGAALNCPPETGYEALATILGINEAVETGRRVAFSPGDFTV